MKNNELMMLGLAAVGVSGAVIYSNKGLRDEIKGTLSNMSSSGGKVVSQAMDMSFLSDMVGTIGEMAKNGKEKVIETYNYVEKEIVTIADEGAKFVEKVTDDPLGLEGTTEEVKSWWGKTTNWVGVQVDKIHQGKLGDWTGEAVTNTIFGLSRGGSNATNSMLRKTGGDKTLTNIGNVVKRIVPGGSDGRVSSVAGGTSSAQKETSWSNFIKKASPSEALAEARRQNPGY